MLGDKDVESTWTEVYKDEDKGGILIITSKYKQFFDSKIRGGLNKYDKGGRARNEDLIKELKAYTKEIGGK